MSDFSLFELKKMIKESTDQTLILVHQALWSCVDWNGCKENGSEHDWRKDWGECVQLLRRFLLGHQMDRSQYEGSLVGWVAWKKTVNCFTAIIYYDVLSIMSFQMSLKHFKLNPKRNPENFCE